MMKKLQICILSLFLFTFACAQDKNKVNKENDYELIVGDLDIPWGFTFLPDGSMLITEKKGELIHYQDGNKTTISGLPDIYVRGQGGFMDIIIDPDYSTNGWIYFSYGSAGRTGNGGNTAIARAKLRNNQLSDLQVLYKASPNSRVGRHFGSRLAFDNDGFLYFSIGDRGNRDENPQDVTRDCGKIYRIFPNGTIPEDNPFVNIKNAKTAIYSYGHRNPQGMIKHPETGEIWTHEHGPKGGDEINIISKGKNYGWPVISYGVNYNGTKFTDITSKDGMEQPLHQWTPSIAPSGMAFISSDKYGDWKGNLLVGSLKFQYLDLCFIENGKVVKEERLLDGIGRVRSIRQSTDGYMYIGVENLGIVRLQRK